MVTATRIAMNHLLYINIILVQSYRAPFITAPPRAAGEYIVYFIFRTSTGDRKVFLEY